MTTGPHSTDSMNEINPIDLEGEHLPIRELVAMCFTHRIANCPDCVVTTYGVGVRREVVRQSQKPSNFERLFFRFGRYTAYLLAVLLSGGIYLLVT